MGAAASLVEGKIDETRARELFGDSFDMSVFDSIKDQDGFITKDSLDALDPKAIAELQSTAEQATPPVANVEPWLAGVLIKEKNDLELLASAGSSATGLDPVTLVFENRTDAALTLCWVDENSKLNHYYRINPSQGPEAIQDGSVSASHSEFASLGDLFVIFWQDPASPTPAVVSEVQMESLVAAYRPTARLGGCAHLIELTGTRSSPSVRLAKGPNGGRTIDTSAKVYDTEMLAGFEVKFEPGVFEAHPTLRDTLQADLTEAMRRVPPGAAAALRAGTTWWVNKSLTYGREGNPTVGRSMTYHPTNGSGWLQGQGMTVAKAGGVEIFDPRDFLGDRDLWGEGGVVLHELTHAFHDRCVPSGWSNAAVQERFQEATARGVLDAVRVHGPQGFERPGEAIEAAQSNPGANSDGLSGAAVPTPGLRGAQPNQTEGKGALADEVGSKPLGAQVRLRKAYANSNPMEFFAELSVAFFEPNPEIEYNKWEPFNASQLEKMLPDAYSVLHELWQSAEGNQGSTSAGSGKIANPAGDGSGATTVGDTSS